MDIRKWKQWDCSWSWRFWFWRYCTYFSATRDL